MKQEETERNRKTGKNWTILKETRRNRKKQEETGRDRMKQEETGRKGRNSKKK